MALLRRSIAVLALGTLLGTAPVGAPATAGPPLRPVLLPAEIPASERARLQQVAGAASVSTRLEAAAFPARREVFEYLLDHPDFATHVTRALRLARYRIWRTREGLYLDDGWGAKGHFEVVYAAPGLRVMYARGKYDQRWLPDITGEAVIVLEYGSRADRDGKSQVATAISGFVKIDNSVLALVTRATSLATRKANLEAERLARVFARTSQAIEENPGAVIELLRQRPEVPARELEEFRQLLDSPLVKSPSLSSPRTSTP